MAAGPTADQVGLPERAPIAVIAVPRILFFLHDNGHRISEMNTLKRPDLSDIKHGDWVHRRLPQAWRPYTRLARLDHPVGIWLTLFPCWAALIQASHGFTDLVHLTVFSLGALVNTPLRRALQGEPWFTGKKNGSGQ